MTAEQGNPYKLINDLCNDAAVIAEHNGLASVLVDLDRLQRNLRLVEAEMKPAEVQAALAANNAGPDGKDRGPILGCKSLSYVDLRNADLRNADLWGSDLRRVRMSGADLRGANLHHSNIQGADLSGAIGYITGPQRSDGYRFDLRIVGGKWCVVAGCYTANNWSIDQYRDHAASYEDAAKTTETLTILRYLEDRSKHVGTGE